MDEIDGDQILDMYSVKSLAGKIVERQAQLESDRLDKPEPMSNWAGEPVYRIQSVTGSLVLV